jgi:hypothetical protein
MIRDVSRIATRLGGALFLVLAACTASPTVTVVRIAPGDKAAEVKGDPVKLKHGNQEPFAGAIGGYYAIRNEADWKAAWRPGRLPPFPQIDPARHMLFFAVAPDREIAKMRVERAVETGTFLYVWVRETKAGEGCGSRAPARAFDLATAPRVDKPVKFFVEEDSAESCGPPPTASVECRLPKEQTWSKTVSAQPGDTVECTMTAASHGTFELVDRSLSMSAVPPGSTAKLAFKSGAQRGEIELDVYGTYLVFAEAADEGGRRGSATATIEVKPPKTKDVLVQLVWAGFDRSDTPDTFPRVNLRVAEEGPKGQRCSAQIPVPGLCDVKARGAYTYMRIPEGKRQLPISVQFMDERAEKGPGPCVHVWYDGERTAETCDRKHRDAEEIWKVGTLDTATGKIAMEGAPPEPVATAADGGVAAAADASPAMADAGTVRGAK